jgi:hypothetical protein
VVVVVELAEVIIIIVVVVVVVVVVVLCSLEFSSAQFYKKYLKVFCKTTPN